MSGYPPYVPIEEENPPSRCSSTGGPAPSYPSAAPSPYDAACAPMYPSGYTDPYSSPYAYPHPAVYSGAPPQAMYGVGPPPPAGSTGAVAIGTHVLIPPPALAPERRKVSCMAVTEVIFAVLLCWFAIAAIESRWSKIELEMFGKHSHVTFHLSRVVQDGDSGYLEKETFHSYTDYKRSFDGECVEKIGDKFKEASDGAKGTLVFSFVFAITIAVLSFIAMSSRLKNPKIGVALMVVFIVAVFFYGIPASVWSDKVPSKQDIIDCYDFESATYSRIDNAPGLLLVGVVLCLIGSILACLDLKSAKRYRQEQSMREPISV
jgi:hypothetical protein